MGRVRTIARRSFLIGSAAFGGGIAFGVYKAHAPHGNPLEDQLASGEATFNPWVMIDKDKITLVAPHADKGQGVFSAQAALIAEELDVELDQVEVIFGAPHAAYYNAAIIEDGLPFLPTDDSQFAEGARSLAGGVMHAFLPMMATGGSSTIPNVFEKLRRAGALARETIKAGAAKQFGVPIAELGTTGGAVILPDGEAVPYTALVASAGKAPTPRRIELRDPSQWRLIGKPMARVDMAEKVLGTLTYGIDHQAEGLLHATVRVNPRQGGDVVRWSAPNFGPHIKDLVRITGGFAIIAENTWRAFQAIRQIEVEWSDAPYPHEQADHWAVLEKTLENGDLNGTPRNEGDVTAAQRQGDVFEAEYRSPYVAHAPLEPLNATILVTEDRVDIWTGHQIQMFAESIVAGITGHATKDVHLHNMFIGGSFGHRLEFEHLKQAAEIGRHMPDTPIKLTYSREEDFAHDFPRHITMGRGKGTVANGQVHSLDVQLAAPSVVGSQTSRMGLSLGGPDSQLHAGAWDNPYFNLPSFRVRSYKAPELAPTSSWRSVGAAPNGFIFDSFLDEMIHQAGADPLEERIRLMGHDVSEKVLETVGLMSSWGGELAPNKGRGVAFVMSFGVPSAQVIEVTKTDKGIKIDKVWAAFDVGTVVDPVNFENLVQGGIVFGLGHAINCEITYADGKAMQTNYHAHGGMRLYQCPEIEVRGLENGPKIRGIGEPPVPPAAPALANAIFAATGQRIRTLPLHKSIRFV